MKLQHALGAPALPASPLLAIITQYDGNKTGLFFLKSPFKHNIEIGGQEASNSSCPVFFFKNQLRYTVPFWSSYEAIESSLDNKACQGQSHQKMKRVHTHSMLALCTGRFRLPGYFSTTRQRFKHRLLDLKRYPEDVV